MSVSDPVADDEGILRHIPGGTLFQAPGPRVTSRNFDLRVGETGVSVSRASLTTPDELMARLGNPDTGSKIAIVTVGDVRALGLEVVPVPVDYDQGHAEIRSAAADLNLKSVRRQLAQLFQFLPVAGA
jgi:hypothetical protein